jgi:aspartyl-tRNA(Asn)/glutamyl-tRNA(Gln) amidotransferase subunit B
MVKLPRDIAKRFEIDFGLSEYDATQLTQSRGLTKYFETVTATSGQAKLSANWVLGEVSAFINKLGIAIDDVEVPNPIAVGELIKRISSGEINGAGARTAFQALCQQRHDGIADLGTYIEMIDKIIQDKDLKQMNDTGALEKIVDEVLAANAKNVAEFKAGNEKALNALVGQIMKASKGKANPQQVNELLRSKLV